MSFLLIPEYQVCKIKYEAIGPEFSWKIKVVKVCEVIYSQKLTTK